MSPTLPLFAIYAMVATNDPRLDDSRIVAAHYRSADPEWYSGTKTHYRLFELPPQLHCNVPLDSDQHNPHDTGGTCYFHTQASCDHYRTRLVASWAAEPDKSFYPSNVVASRCAPWSPDSNSGTDL